MTQPYRGPVAPGARQPDLAGCRPRVVLATVVVGFAQAGLSAVGTLFLLFLLASISGDEVDTAMYAALWGVTLVQAAGTGLLALGAVRLRAGAGPRLFALAMAGQLLICLLWLVFFLTVADREMGALPTDLAGSIGYPLCFAVLPVTGFALVGSRGVRRASRRTTR